MRKLLLLPLFLLTALAVATGCHSNTPAQQARVYHLHGKVVSIDTGQGQLIVDHEAIPGFMGAMTMPYKVKDTAQLGALHPGDLVHADVLVPADRNADLYLAHIVVESHATAAPGK